MQFSMVDAVKPTVGITEYRTVNAAQYEAELRGQDCRLYGPINVHPAVHKDTTTANTETTNPRI